MNVEKIRASWVNPEPVQAVINRSNPEFVRGLYDFCLALNLRVQVEDNSGDVIPNRVSLVTVEGWPVGNLAYSRDLSGYYFLFTSVFVQKDRSDRRGTRSQRSASKMSSLISAIKKAGEIPTSEKALEKDSLGITYALSQITRQRNEPSMTLSGAEAIAAAEVMLYGDSINKSLYQHRIEQLYNEYKKSVEKYTDTQSTLKRFARGMKVIGVSVRGGVASYITGRVTCDPDNVRKVTLHGPLKRYSTLEGSEFATDAAIIRTYMEDKRARGYTYPNELNIIRVDAYYEDIDIATGYTGEGFTWVVIPESGE